MESPEVCFSGDVIRRTALVAHLRMAEMRHPRVSLWAMDEHRVGLKPILKTVWASTGQPFVCPVQPRYEWLYIYAFVNPETGESRFWLVPEVSKLAYQMVMAAFARSVGAGERHRVLIVEDGAGFHVPPLEGHPPGIQTITMPTYSPELQPVERVWDLTDATVANRWFETMDDFTQPLGQQCAWLETRPNLLSQQTLFQ